MAFELYGMLAGNVSPMTGENVKPAYGGEEEAFLKKVVTPIYEVVAKVLYIFIFWRLHVLDVGFNRVAFDYFYDVLLDRKLKEANEEDQSILNGGIMMI